MSDTQSARTAIRKWLQGIDGKSTVKPAEVLSEQQKTERISRHHSKPRRRTKYHSEIEGPQNEEAGQKRYRYGKDGDRQKTIPDKALSTNPLQAQSQEHSKAVAAITTDGHGLAERLGLHAPFRVLRDRSDDSIREAQSRPQKRRRRSSTSSYLEPAAPNPLSDNDHADSSHSTILRTAGTRPALGDEDNNSQSTAPKDLGVLQPPPEKSSVSYRKRPRHKTRKDRYELKESSRDREKTKQDTKKNRAEKKSKKPKRKEKSGAALMHSFAAQNVAHDRLTLKPAKTLGLFGKGKASSPVRRRGIPDLAFSEMTFLTSRREKPKGSFEDSSSKHYDTKKRRMLTKAADTEAEFSRYFLSAKSPSLDVTTSQCQQDREDRRRSQDHGSPQALVDLPERSFLGFGSCGPNTTRSPAKHLDDKDSRSPTPSTSYLTWSQSRGASNASPPPGRRNHVGSLKSSIFANRKNTSPTSQQTHHSVPPVSPPQERETSPGAQRAAFRPCSKHKTTDKAPSQNNESPLVIAEPSKLGVKSQSRGDTGTVDLDATDIPQNINGSIPGSTDLSKSATYDCPESASTAPKQPAHQFTGHEPRYKPLGRHIPSQMQIIPPDRDQLDDILEALLKDCNTYVDRSDEIRVSAEIPQDSRKPDHAFIESTHTSEPPAPAPNTSQNPCSAKSELVPTIDESMPKNTPFTRSLNVSSKPSLDYLQDRPPSRMHNEMNLMNAWNGYDTFYGGQQEPADCMQNTSIGHILPTEAVQDDLVSALGKSYHGVRPCERIAGCHPAGLRDGFDDHGPHSFESPQVRSEYDNHQRARRGEWYDQPINDQTSDETGGSLLDMSYEGFDDETIALNHAIEYQEKEQSCTQRTDEPKTEDQRFTTDVSDTCRSRRPWQHASSKHGLRAPPNRDWVQDDGSAMSDFWTPHKLY